MNDHTFILCILRFVGQTEWFIADQRGKFSWDFLNHKDALLEEVNLNYTLINQRGLSNLGNRLILTTTLCWKWQHLVKGFIFFWLQRDRPLWKHCRYEDALKWTTGSWPGFIFSGTLWKNWTSLIVHLLPQVDCLRWGTSSQYLNTADLSYSLHARHDKCCQPLMCCVTDDYGVWTCRPSPGFQTLVWSLSCWRKCCHSVTSLLLATTSAWGRAVKKEEKNNPKVRSESGTSRIWRTERKSDKVENKWMKWTLNSWQKT